MFTGIITAMANVLAVSPGKGGLELTIDKPKGFVGAQEGDSVAINGVCLTVKSHNGSLVFDVVPETLSRSNLKDLKKGELVNIEPSLRVGDFVGGHMVYGHVDAACAIVAKEPEGQGYRLWCSTPRDLRKLIVEKGYVSLDGTSLTVARVKGDTFAVALIPETLKRTTLGRKAVGDSVNIEVDPVARYIAAYMRDRAPSQRKTTRGR